MNGPEAEARVSEDRFIRETGAAAAIAELAEPVLEGLGFRLVLVRILSGQGMVVEIMAERPDGSMTIDDCRAVSLALSPVLDVHDPVPSSYRLQVSSPGIDRPLVRPSDFDQWAGFEAKLELKELVDGRRRFRGILEGFEDGEVRIEVDLGKDQGVKLLGLPVSLVGEAKLVLTDALVRESLGRSKRALSELEEAQAIASAEAGFAAGEGSATAAAGAASEADSKPAERRRGKSAAPARSARGARRGR
ncbi:MAG: ribosome maturation factor RimP [Hyphomicrobiaceae bacterium]